MKYFKKLIGERIYLSPRNTEDFEIFTKWMNDFQVSDYIGRSGQLISLEGEKKYLEDHANDEATFGIVTLDNDELIGVVGLEEIAYNCRKATLGIFIGNDKYWSKGYGTEAIQLLLDYGFNYLNLNNVYLDVLAINERAIKCYKKCGFKECGRRRKSEFINGKYFDLMSMDILAEEFKGNFIKNKNV